MPRSINSRMAALEVQYVRRKVEKTAAAYGIDPDELTAEVHALLRLSLPDQLAAVDRLAGDMPADDIEAIKETLVREYRP